MWPASTMKILLILFFQLSSALYWAQARELTKSTLDSIVQLLARIDTKDQSNRSLSWNCEAYKKEMAAGNTSWPQKRNK